MVEPHAGPPTSGIEQMRQVLSDLESLQALAEERGDTSRVEQLERVASAYREQLRQRESDEAPPAPA